MDKVRCPACRGAKKIPKLGGMVGECNTCNGTGQINATDKPKPVEVIADVISKELINAVADCVPATTVEKVSITIQNDQYLEAGYTDDGDLKVKIDGKRALYKRKTASK